MPAHWPEPAKKRTTKRALPVKQTTVCVVCQRTFERFTAWEKHADQELHFRSRFPLPEG